MIRYIVGILLALTILFGGFAYNQYSKVQILTGQVTTYKSAAEENLKAKEASDASCKVTVEALQALHKGQIELIQAREATISKINKLPTLTIKEKKDAAPTQSKNYSDDERLSPELMLLLDEAYCHGDKDSCTKTSH